MRRPHGCVRCRARESANLRIPSASVRRFRSVDLHERTEPTLPLRDRSRVLVLTHLAHPFFGRAKHRRRCDDERNQRPAQIRRQVTIRRIEPLVAKQRARVVDPPCEQIVTESRPQPRERLPLGVDDAHGRGAGRQPDRQRTSQAVEPAMQLRAHRAVRTLQHPCDLSRVESVHQMEPQHRSVRLGDAVDGHRKCSRPLARFDLGTWIDNVARSWRPRNDGSPRTAARRARVVRQDPIAARDRAAAQGLRATREDRHRGPRWDSACRGLPCRSRHRRQTANAEERTPKTVAPREESRHYRPNQPRHDTMLRIERRRRLDRRHERRLQQVLGRRLDGREVPREPEQFRRRAVVDRSQRPGIAGATEPAERAIDAKCEHTGTGPERRVALHPAFGIRTRPRIGVAVRRRSPSFAVVPRRAHVL